MLVAPSILSADFGNLAQDVKRVCTAGADYIHVDVMDGHFVPNLTIGPMVVEAVSKATTVPMDVHLMVENNSFFVDLFAPLKPEFITFHIEEEKHPHRLIQKIKDYGIKAGVVLNPHTSPEVIKYLLLELDIVLLMSVNPGFGGQKFISSVIEKSKELARMREAAGVNFVIEVDGGVNDKNISELKESGVDMVVAGNFIFRSDDYAQAINALKI